MSGLGKTFEKRGIDPVSRAVGIEPKNFAKKVSDIFDFMPKMPDPLPPPEPAKPMPIPDDESVKAARIRAQQIQRRRSGRQSTILTDTGDLGKLGA